MIPIERAARVLSALETQSEDRWRDYLPAVVAVVDALHEPSEFMQEAGGEIFRTYNPHHAEFALQSDAANCWRLMIDAMRKGNF